MTVVSSVPDTKFRADRSTSSLCHLLLFLLPFAQLSVGGHAGVPAGLIAALMMAPVWLPRLYIRPAGKRFLVLATLTLIAGWAVSLVGGSPFSSSDAIALTAILVSVVTHFSVMACAMEVSSKLWTPLAVFALGTAIAGLAAPSLWKGNVWKFSVHWPISILTVLLVVALGGGLALTCAASAVLIAITLLYDGRSFAGILAASLVLCLMTTRSKSHKQARSQRTSTVALILGGTVAVAVLFVVFSKLATTGALGEDIASRTTVQANGGGTFSLLTTGRPEYLASFALMGAHPLGMGIGAMPTYADLGIMENALSPVVDASNSEYFQTYLTGDRIELHSTVFDMWAHFSWPGAALAVLLVLNCFRGVRTSLSLENMRFAGKFAMMILLINSIWDFLFSPIAGSIYILAISSAFAAGVASRYAGASESTLVGS